MALAKRHDLIRNLQTALPRGSPFDHQQLKKLGVSSALAHHYLKSGWLVRLGRGIFAFPNDTLRAQMLETARHIAVPECFMNG